VNSCRPRMSPVNNSQPARQRAPSTNPNGIASSSPRLRGTSYLGSTSNKHFQPQRGCGHSFRPSLRRWPCSPKVGVCAPTLGFGPQPRWCC
jgi:hypothetical protein